MPPKNQPAKGNQQQQEQQRPAAEAGEPVKEPRRHKATYASDKRNGGYLVRVVGPDAAKFGGKEVPVTRRDNSENVEKLEGLVWHGVDKDTSQPVALYRFTQRPRESVELEF